MRIKRSLSVFAALTLMAAAISCGGSSGSPSAGEKITIVGTAATGAPISGTVYVKDVEGDMNSAVINADGSFEVEVADTDGPYVLMADGTSGGSPVTLYSISEGSGRANITPVTNIIVALAVQNDPAIVFPESDMTTQGELANNIPDIDTAKTAIGGFVENVYPSFGIDSDFDLIESEFSADSTGFDLLLDKVDFTVETSGANKVVRVKAEDTGTVYYEQNVTSGTPAINNEAGFTSNFHDTDYPQLTGVNISTSTVNTTTGDVDLVVTVNSTDNLSGIKSIYSVGFRSPSGNQYATVGDLTRVSGTNMNGVYTGTIKFKQYCESGVWNIYRIFTSDNAGNWHCFENSELTTLGYGRTVTVTSIPDTDYPQLTGVNISTSTVNTTTGDVDLVVTVNSTDNLSGIKSIYSVGFRSPSGNQHVSVADLTRVSGTNMNGVYTGTIKFKQYCESGVWNIYRIYTSDNAGNWHCFENSELTTLGYGRTVTVTSIPDTAYPQLTGVSFSTSTVNTNSGSVDVLVTVNSTDNLSGINSIYSVGFRSPSGNQYATVGDLTRVSGTNMNGVYTGTIRFNQYCEAGVWNIYRIYTSDNAGNWHCFENSELTSAGFGFTVTVEE